MKSPILIAAVTAAVAGAGSAALVVAAMAPARPAQQGDVVAAATPGAEEVDLRHELRELRADNAALMDRVRALEQMKPAVEPSRTQVALEPAPEQAAKTREIVALAAALTDPNAPLPENLKSGVAEALEAIRAEEEAERERRRQEAAAKRLEERVQRYVDELGLNAYQAGELRVAMTLEESKRNALFAEMREGDGDFTQVRERMGEIRDEAQKTITNALTPEQYEKYRESSRRDFGRGGFDRGGDRGEDRGGDSGGGRDRGGRGN
jgi:hypothetical protein